MDKIYENIKFQIQHVRDPTAPILIYTGVGTSAGMRNANNILELENYHQFPPFLRELYNNIPNLYIFVVLVDPMQEEPIYMAADFQLALVLIDDNINPHYSQKFYLSQDNRITVHVYKESVYTEADDNALDYGVDITPHLRDLNEYAMQNNIATIYHDFIGRANKKVAQLFDPDLHEHLDHIIYGINMRQDLGCYFDLTSLGAYMPYKIIIGNNGGSSSRQALYFFNYYKYILKNDYKLAAAEKKTYSIYMQSSIELQKQLIVKDIKEYLQTKIVSTLRIVYFLKTGKETTAHAYFLEDLPKGTVRTHASELYKSKSYHDLFEYLKHTFGQELNVICYLLELDLDGYELLSFCTGSDKPYEWSTNLKYFC